MNKAKHPPHPVLIVDDESQALQSFSMALRTMGINNIITQDNAAQAMDSVAEHDPDCVLLDLVMPGVSGEDILEDIAVKHPELPVIMVTGIDDVETAVRCMKKGALDYILKPVHRENLDAALNRALEIRRLKRINAILSRHVAAQADQPHQAFSGMITACDRMQAVFRYCEAVASGREPVLVTGETGTGKELVSRAIHEISGRQGEFVAVNAAGLDDQAFSDTLFGHVRGAFTGAESSRPGFIEQAAGGTLFLDEIGDLDPASQIKLLRVLQERTYYPLGSDMAKPMDARVIVATHADLKLAMDEGRLRQDFYYRLRTHQVHLPPLRERSGDLSLLLDHFLEQAAMEMGKPRPTAPAELPVLLDNHPFPGNVRELRAMVFDAVGAHRSGVLSLESFKRKISGSDSGEPDKKPNQAEMDPDRNVFSATDHLPTISRATKDLIDEAMRRSQGNQRMAATWLGISHQALSKRLKRSS